MYISDDSQAEASPQTDVGNEPVTDNSESPSESTGSATSSNPVFNLIQSLQQGFNVPSLSNQQSPQTLPILSSLGQGAAIQYAQMIELEGGEGSIIYFPPQVLNLEVGDVLYLREKQIPQTEDGIIVQVIEKGTVSYPQADVKALFRLMASVRAYQLARSHNEAPETIDQFLSLSFKVRASIINGGWAAHEGRVVTRNVDIFRISPLVLIENIISTEP